MSQASPERRAWLADYYGALDAGRYDEAERAFAEDVVTRYPTGHELAGRAALMAVTAKSLGRLASIHHDVKNVWEEGDELIFELAVTYERTDGIKIVRPGTGIFVLDADGLIAEQRLFVDMAGVWD